jgi:hypothetical protein
MQLCGYTVRLITMATALCGAFYRVPQADRDFNFLQNRPADRSLCHVRVKAMLALKHQWRERGPLKPGEMQIERTE